MNNDRVTHSETRQTRERMIVRHRGTMIVRELDRETERLKAERQT